MGHGTHHSIPSPARHAYVMPYQVLGDVFLAFYKVESKRFTTFHKSYNDVVSHIFSWRKMIKSQ